MKNIIRLPLIMYYRAKTKSKISMRTIINNKTKLGGMNKIEKANVSSSDIGFGTYLLSGNFDNCSIGSFCSIGQNVSIVDADHPIGFVSSYPGFYKTINKDIFLVNSTTRIREHRTCSNGRKVCIGNDVWIGNNVTIRGGGYYL